MRESHSFKSSTVRTKSTASKSKLKVFKMKIDKNPKTDRNDEIKQSIDSTSSNKVQKILERHRKFKEEDSHFKPNGTMDVSRSQVQSLTNQERRAKNMSNMSVQP